MHPLRLHLILFCVIGAYTTLGIRLYDIQIRHGDLYSAQAESQYKLAGFFEPHRGLITITDKKGTILPIAENRPYRVVIAVTKNIRDKDAAVENLAPILGMGHEELRKVFDKKGSYRVIMKDPTDEQVTKLVEAAIPGIQIDQQEKRSYPMGSIASQVVGFTGPGKDDDAVQGRYGIEKEFEAGLAGTPGSMDEIAELMPAQGTDIALTIDRPIQAEAEKILADLVREKKAIAGSAIVMDPMSGKVIAMASVPDFDPNEYSDYPVAAFTNPTVQARYEPGSVFKVLTVAIGLDTGSITPDMTFYDTGKLTFKDGKTVRNWDLKAHGTVTMTNIIEESLNTGAAFMESKIGHRPFYDYLLKFGLDKPTGIRLPGEVSGNLKNIKTHTADIDFAAASFGQGVAVTPLQLITAVSVLANGGNLMRPYITGNEQPETVRRTIGADAAKKATAMMESAVVKAKVAHIPHYRIAGKTGTAQAVDFVRGGYSKDVINTYVGFGPVSAPRFIILIKLDKPAGAPLAGTTVVPAFRKLAEFIIDYYGIPPDNLPKETGNG